MSQNQSENPLIKALPPETDYLSYLTIVEYNINEEQLPILHQILQDATLTANIGWDLVHLLLPFLPHSKLCLQDVARLGNPREVVLKVTELLEKLNSPDEDDEDLRSEDLEDVGDAEEVKVVDGGAQNGNRRTQTSSIEVQFCALIDMLQTLLPRIKTKFPSRFLSTSLQALLPAYAMVAAEEQATETVITFIKALSGTGRPKLPPRASSTAVPNQKDEIPQSAPDPEGNDGSVGIEEEALQKRLLQAFLTFVLEAYMTALPLIEDVPGMAWCSRIQEYQKPDSVIPGRRTFTELFDSGQGHLHSRDAIVGQFTVISIHLSLYTNFLTFNRPFLATCRFRLQPYSQPSSLLLLLPQLLQICHPLHPKSHSRFQALFTSLLHLAWHQPFLGLPPPFPLSTAFPNMPPSSLNSSAPLPPPAQGPNRLP